MKHVSSRCRLRDVAYVSEVDDSHQTNTLEYIFKMNSRHLPKYFTQLPRINRPVQLFAATGILALGLSGCSGGGESNTPGAVATSSATVNAQTATGTRRTQGLTLPAATISTDHVNDPVPPRKQWFADNKFGMFIHYGLYSVAGGMFPYPNGTVAPKRAEWYLSDTGVKLSEYAKLRQGFTSANFDANAIADYAAKAGMSYVCITSMHHDGFALWQSDAATAPGSLAIRPDQRWDLTTTPTGTRDILGELKTALDAKGIDLCLYHTVMNWENPHYPGRLGGNDWFSNTTDMAKFQTYLHKSVGEIMDRYHPKYLWFDGFWDAGWNQANGEALRNFIYAKDPNVLINDRTDPSAGGLDALNDSAAGDVVTPEKNIPTKLIDPSITWETCDTSIDNGVWGYNSVSQTYKTPKALVWDLISASSHGGNFLLNYGPDGTGALPPGSKSSLDSLAGWSGRHLESFRQTRGGIATEYTPWGNTTQRQLSNGNTYLYAFVKNWPTDGKLTVGGITNDVVGATLMETTTALKVAKDASGAGLTITGLPTAAPDDIASVVRIELVGRRAIAATLPNAQDGALTLYPVEAVLTNGMAMEYKDNARSNLGFWTDINATATWRVTAPAAGTYAVFVDYAVDPSTPGSTIKLSSSSTSSSAQMVVNSTGSWTAWQTVQLPTTVDLSAGTQNLVLAAVNKLGNAVANIKSIKLRPVKTAGKPIVLTPAQAATTQGIRPVDTSGALGWWTNSAGTITWPVNTPKAGEYIVSLSYSAQADAAGSKVNVMAGSAQQTFTVGSTGSWETFVDTILPTPVTMPAGANQLKLNVANMATWAVANIKSVTLTPVLPGGYADVVGAGLCLQNNNATLGCWTNKQATSTWIIATPPAGSNHQQVVLNYSAEPASAGSVVYFQIGNQKISYTVPSTGSWTTYQTVVVPGVFNIAGSSTPSVQTLTVGATSVNGAAPMNIGAVTLINLD